MDYENFAPDPIPDDPFAAAPAVEDDPFGAAVEDDPFAASPAEVEDPFAAAPVEEDAPVEEAAPADDPFGASEATFPEEVEETPVTLDAAPQEILPESTALAEWQSARSEVLRERRDKAREDKENQREQGKAKLSSFLSERAAKLEQIKLNNRDEEKNQLAEMANVMENGTEWEKVHKLVNLTPKPNEKPGSSRVDRMRGLLIQMKHK